MGLDRSELQLVKFWLFGFRQLRDDFLRLLALDSDNVRANSVLDRALV